MSSLRNEAKELALKAIKYDEEENFAEASKFYVKAAEKLNYIYKVETNPGSKEILKKKAFEYCQRAADLKGLTLEKTNSKGSTSGESTSNGSQSSSPTTSLNINKDSPKKENEVKKSEDKKIEDKKGEDKKEGETLKKTPDQDPETKKLMEELASCVVTEKPNVKWEDVAGLEKAKEALKEAVILPMRFPQLFTGKRKPWKGILLYGPPGTGKSYLAKACATESKGTFLSVSASNIVSKWMGQSERLVKAMFDLARASKPAVIFIDEIDSLLTARSEGENESTRRVKTEFLVQMQGVGKQDDGILVLGATNIPWDLDPAARRRFQKKIYINLPDFEARRAMLKLNLGNTTASLTEDDFDDLANRTEGYSGSDIYTLTQDAIYEPLRKCHSAQYFKKKDIKYYVPCSPSDVGAFAMKMHDIPEPELLMPPDVSMEDYLVAMGKIKPTVSEKDLEKQDDFTKEFGQEG